MAESDKMIRFIVNLLRLMHDYGIQPSHIQARF